MRKSFAVLTMFALTSTAVWAQPGPDGPGGGGPGGRGGFGPPPNPLMEALDTNKDGEISAEEISAAVAALKTLDKDGDGKLAGEEIRPPRPSFGNRGQGGRPGGNFTPESMISRWMENDKDGDGALTAEELGQRGTRMLENGDMNDDGKLDKAELEAMAKQFMERFQNGGGRRPGGDGGDRRPGGGGDEAPRPARPSA
ncbi:MAG: hypothetical protein KDA90_11080 [Planctomycetaceae bacterium]|nr:hypothetical protein [Planctomycetaceae bacterium]